MAWVEDFDERQIKEIGTLEVLAAGGLILPPAFDVAPVLTSLAASGVMLLMVGAGATHLRRRELGMLPVNLLLAALALFVAIERFGPHSL
jgi:DoxX-like family